jgi:hypothetical protein
MRNDHLSFFAGNGDLVVLFDFVHRVDLGRNMDMKTVRRNVAVAPLVTI